MSVEKPLVSGFKDEDKQLSTLEQKYKLKSSLHQS